MSLCICILIALSFRLCRGANEEPPRWQGYVRGESPDILGYTNGEAFLSGFDAPSYSHTQQGYAGLASVPHMQWHAGDMHHTARMGPPFVSKNQLEQQAWHGSGFSQGEDHVSQELGSSAPTTRLPRQRHRWNRGKVVEGAMNDIVGDSEDEFFMPSRTPELKAKVGRLWRQKGLWVGMPVKELAAGMAEIKVQLGSSKYSRSVGQITANYVGDHVRASAAYKEDVQALGKRFTKKIIRLEKKSQKLHPDYTTYQHEVEVLSGVRFLNDRDAYIRSKKEEEEEEVRLDMEAEQAWHLVSTSQELATEQYAAGLSHTPPSDLPLDMLEKASRHTDLPLHPDSFYDLSDLLRRYLLRILHKTPIEIDAFNLSRNRWLRESQSLRENMPI